MNTNFSDEKRDEYFSSPEKAYLKCIRMLAKQEYSAKKLRDKLKTTGFTQEAREAAIERVTQEGYLSDQRYLVARAKGLARKGYSFLFIQKKLQQEGVAITVAQITQILNDEGVDEANILEHEISKKWNRKLSSDGIDFSLKLKKFKYSFVQKGFQYDMVNELVEKNRR